jgi:hypothetical protein
VPANALPTTTARFAEEVFGYLPRVDQRRWAAAYLHGLLVTEGRKTPQNLAAALSDCRTAALSLQQFISSSPWDWQQARQRLSRICGITTARSMVATTAVLPKRGDQAVGSHRRFVPHLRRTVKCQAAPGLFAVGSAHVLPVDWSLYLDRNWTDDLERRRRARIPDVLGHRSAGNLVLDMIDQVRDHCVTPPLITDLSLAEEAPGLADALASRGLSYLLEVGPALSVLPASGRHQSVSARALFSSIREPRRRSAPPRSALVRVATGDGHAVGPGCVQRVWALGDPLDASGCRYWLSSPSIRGNDVFRTLIGDAARATGALGNMAADFGLRDFSGRSYIGWHHHVTMVSAAYVLSRAGDISGESSPLQQAPAA